MCCQPHGQVRSAEPSCLCCSGTYSCWSKMPVITWTSCMRRVKRSISCFISVLKYSGLYLGVKAVWFYFKVREDFFVLLSNDWLWSSQPNGEVGSSAVGSPPCVSCPASPRLFCITPCKGDFSSQSIALEVACVFDYHSHPWKSVMVWTAPSLLVQHPLCRTGSWWPWTMRSQPRQQRMLDAASVDRLAELVVRLLCLNHKFIPFLCSW